MKNTDERTGAFYAILSYVMWGFVPIYWKFIHYVPAGEILAHRVLWSFVFMVFLLLFSKKWMPFVSYLKEICKSPKKFAALMTASLLVTANWGLFIWAVNSNNILETSLGYYINPLVSVLLGVIVLKERLNGAQLLSFLLAAIGVLTLAVYHGSVPWLALLLAVTFGLYGLAKKMIKADSSIGLTLETMMVTPFAIGYLIYLLFTTDSQFFGSFDTSLFLIGGGIVTALPLLYFTKGAQKVPLSMMGILQYITPTLTLLLGVFMYDEPFTKTHFIAFVFIWSALVIYSFSKTKWGLYGAAKLKEKIKMGA